MASTGTLPRDMAVRQEVRTIVVIGAQTSGKTCIVHRLIEEPIDFFTYKPTIDECYNITWKLPGSKRLQVRIIDTAAWDEFPAMQSLFVKMSHLVIIVYDVTRSDATQRTLDLVADVKRIKGDVDFLIVGNKCDNLRKEDKFMPSNLTDSIGNHCIGHLYTSAKSEQGIMGLKQLILCTKSKLTEGFFTELEQVPKRGKLKKKLHGIAINLHRKKWQLKLSSAPQPDVKEKASTLDSKEPNKNRRYDRNSNEIGRRSHPLVNPGLHHNCDEENTRRTLENRHKRLSQYEKDETLFSDNEFLLSSGSQSDYSPIASPSTSRRGSRHLTTQLDFGARRKSMDFSKLELVTDPLEDRQRPNLTRKKSVSCNVHEPNPETNASELFTRYTNGDNTTKTKNNNVRSALSDSEDELLSRSTGKLSSIINIPFNKMPVSYYTLGHSDVYQRMMAKSSEHLNQNRVSNLRAFSRQHSSADDLPNVRKETFIK